MYVNEKQKQHDKLFILHDYYYILYIFIHNKRWIAFVEKSTMAETFYNFFLCKLHNISAHMEKSINNIKRTWLKILKKEIYSRKWGGWRNWCFMLLSCHMYLLQKKLSVCKNFLRSFCMHFIFCCSGSFIEQYNELCIGEHFFAVILQI